MALVVNNRHVSAGDIRVMGSIPGLGRSPGEMHSNLLQSSLENPMDRGVWRSQSRTQLKRSSTHAWYCFLKHFSSLLLMEINIHSGFLKV